MLVIAFLSIFVILAIPEYRRRIVVVLGAKTTLADQGMIKLGKTHNLLTFLHGKHLMLLLSPSLSETHPFKKYSLLTWWHIFDVAEYISRWW